MREIKIYKMNLNHELCNGKVRKEKKRKEIILLHRHDDI